MKCSPALRARRGLLAAWFVLLFALLLPPLAAQDTNAFTDALVVEARSGDWVTSAWAGGVYEGSAPWYWFHRLGRWCYGEADGTGGVWLYEPRLGWWWTEAAAWPWHYALEGQGWYYREVGSGPQRLWSPKADRWFTLDADFAWLDARVWGAFAFAADQYRGAMSEIALNRYPYQMNTGTGQWVVNGSGNWTSGFFPASLMQLFAWTGDGAMLQNVRLRLNDLKTQQYNTSTHDVGFMIGTPFILAYEVTGDTRYRDIAVRGAQSLFTRYNATIGSIDSWEFGEWNRYHETIVDNMMNLELLFWASKQPGGESAWYDAAISHADLTAANLIRPDDSVIHIVAFDPSTGALAFKRDFGGRDTAGAVFGRGQAWAIYGYTVAYRETGETRFYDLAMRLLEYFWTHLKADLVPYHEMTEVVPSAENGRDSSATAVAVAALWNLLPLAPPEDQPLIEARATALLEALLSPGYLGDGAGNGILYHQTNDWSTPTKVDTAISYGDFYLLQALGRYLEYRGVTPGE